MDKRQKLLAKACEIALRHPDLHPFHVAVTAVNIPDHVDETDDFEAFLVGLMHDAVEDDYVDDRELNIFPDEIKAAVYVLSRGDMEDYWDYIDRLKNVALNHPLAIRVKIADATVNLQRCTNNFGYGNLKKRYERVIKELS